VYIYCVYIYIYIYIYIISDYRAIPDNKDNIIEIFLKEQNEETFIVLVTNIGAIYRYYIYLYYILLFVIEFYIYINICMHILF